MADRLILWHRWLPPQGLSPLGAEGAWAWRRHVERRLTDAGGELVGSVGLDVGVSFKTGQRREVVELALSILAEAEGRDDPLEIAFGAAENAVWDAPHGQVLGPALAEASQLAYRARAGELAVSPDIEDRLRDQVLFDRQLGIERGASVGVTVGRAGSQRVSQRPSSQAIAAARSPSRRPSRAPHGASGPTLPPVLANVREGIQRALEQSQRDTVILRASVGAGAADLIEDLERRGPRPFLHLGASPGGVVPLGSLRLALLRDHGTPRAVEEALGGIPGRVLAEVCAGELVALEPLADALRDLARSAADPLWVVMNPLSLVDAATLDAVLAARRRGGPIVVLGRYPVDTALPTPLRDGPTTLEIGLPPLQIVEAVAIASTLLGEQTSTGVARRVAALGGDTILGVTEAARALVATGQLVKHEDRFTWRDRPPTGKQAVDVEHFLRARVQLLSLEARRLLEVICVASDGWSASRIAALAAADGVDPVQLTASQQELVTAGLIHARPSLRPTSDVLRWVIQDHLPPERRMTLRRAAADLLADRGIEAAERAYYLAEGGEPVPALPLLHAAEAAAALAGYERSSVLLRRYVNQLVGEGSQDGTAAFPPPPVTGSVPTAARPSSDAFVAPTGDFEQSFFSEAPPAPTEPDAGESIERPAAEAGFDLPLPPPDAPIEPDSRSSSVGLATPTLELDEEPETAPPPRRSRAPRISSASFPAPPVERDPGEIAASIEDTLSNLTPPPMPAGISSRPPPRARPSSVAVPSPSRPPPDTEQQSGEMPVPDLFRQGGTHVHPTVPPDPAEDHDLLDEPTIPGRPSFMAELRRDDPTPARDTPRRQSSGPAPARRSPAPRSLAEELVDAVRSRDSSHLERSAQKALARGADSAAVVRMKALGDLARGDLDAARLHLDQARQARGGEPSIAGLVAGAAIELQAGDAPQAIRTALRALAFARSQGDPKGEEAARHLLAAAYRRLGREDQANLVEGRAAARVS